MKRNKKQEASELSVSKIKVRRFEIILTSLFFSALILVMIANIVLYMKNDSQEAINNTYNPRQELLAAENIRGMILSKDKKVLAYTKTEVNGDEIREYPYRNLFAHVVGYSTKGKTGVEDSENMNMIFSHDSLGNKIQNELSETKNPGDNIVTTLDVDLQQVCYDALGVYNGAVIVSQPSTGAVLAMVSKPDFDPNQIADLWDDLVKDDASSVLLNRATQGVYPPGSTFKIVTALAYYRQDPEKALSYHYNCNGKFSYEGSTIRCYHGSSHGSEDFTKSFAKSCNSSFANIGTQLEYETLQKTCQSLLFGNALKTKIPYKQSVFALTQSSSTDDKLQTVIGQGHTQMTPLQLNMITAAIANQGKCMTPYVVDHIENAKGNVIKRYAPQNEATMMTQEEAAFLTGLMTEVVKSGTATKLINDSYSAAGKTGSAEFSSNKDDSHAWFTGFAPVEDPKVAVTIIVEGAGSGGEYAVPIAKRIFDAALLGSVQ